MPSVRGQRDGPSLLDEQLGVAAHLPVRPHGHGDAEHGGLKHRVESRPMVTPTYERDVRQRVEVRENADPVYHDHGPGRRVLELRESHGPRQAERRRLLRNAGEMIGVGLVGREQETGPGHLSEQVGEGRQHDRLVRRPR